MSHLLASQDANDKTSLIDIYLEVVTFKTYITSILRVAISQRQVTTHVLFSGHKWCWLNRQDEVCFQVAPYCVC